MLKNKSLYILAIESSADETSAAVFKNGKISSNVVYSQIDSHKKTGGIVPEVAARAHIPKIIPTINEALKGAKINLGRITHIAVSNGPGLITSLRVGVDTAKALAYALQKPIIPINHLEGHLLSGIAGKNFQFSIFPPSGDLPQGDNFQKLFPALGLIVSGGHTMLMLIKDIGKYKILGETMDDAAGEAFDKIAKILGLPYPGGPHLSKLAEKGDPATFDLPRPMLDQKNYNFSFAGLKTAVLYLYNRLRPLPQPLPRPGEGGRRPGEVEELKADIAASTEQAIVDVLVAKTLRAAKEYKVKTILLGGGVAANQKLRETLKRKIKQQLPVSDFLVPTSDLRTDNAGMIALAASFHAKYNHTTTYDKLKIDPNLPLKSWR